MQSAARLLRKEVEDYAKLLTIEMGKLFSEEPLAKPLFPGIKTESDGARIRIGARTPFYFASSSEAKAEVELSANIFEYYAKNAEALLAPESLPVGNPAEGKAILVRDPLGVLLAIEPWNFPYYQIARIIAPQLSAGNTMLLKHASNVPQSAAAFERLMRNAGLPNGAFKNLYAKRSQVELILNDPRVRGVALTGSEDKSTMELGGADAFVVLADADLDKTAKWAVFGRHGAEVARRISTGMVFVNHPTMAKADLPFGGIRNSGYGRELLGLGIKEFINHKLIDVVDIDAEF